MIGTDMLFAAEFGTGQVLWSIFYFFIFFLWIWLVISVFSDIIRSDDLSGWSKALWTIAIIFLPYLGVFMYLVVRGAAMTERRERDARASEQAFQSYIRDAAGSSTSTELARLAELHAGGKLTDAEYVSAKASVLGS